MGELIFILGGARSGKSSTAERMALDMGGANVLYLATAEALDEEMRARIQTHQQTRPSGWRTVEAPRRVAERLRPAQPTAVVLLDCVTLLVSNVLLALPEPSEQAAANAAVLAELTPLLELQREQAATWLVVSNEVGMGLVPPYPLGRLFRDALGLANQTIAQAADQVLLMVAGLPWRLK